MGRRILILGGTGEANALAQALGREPGIEPMVSLAGRTRQAASTGVQTRVGGFGGAEGLSSFLAEQRIALLVDATHPFACRISTNAVDAAQAAGVPRLVLLRPAWQPIAGDIWHGVGGEAEAAALIPPGSRAFLALGRQHLAPFSARGDVWWLVRVVDSPEAPLLEAPHLTITGRGPFSLAGEVDLMKRHAISHLVARNSGGEGGRAKIDAARELSLPVAIISRPPPPPGPVVSTVDEAFDRVMGSLN